MLLVLLFSNVCHAYIYPLGSVIFDILRSRKASQTALWTLKHKFLKGSDTVEVEEKILKENGKYFSLWRVLGSGQATGASYENGSYQFPNQQMRSHSGAFLKYIFANSLDEFREALISERFVRKEQLQVYEKDFAPQGDPQTWSLKANYIIHPDISLVHFGDVIGIASLGYKDQNASRTVVFDRGLRGILKLEWKDSAQPVKTVAWNFQNFAKFPQTSYFPKKAFLNFDGSDFSQTDFISVSYGDANAIKDFKTEYGKAIRSPAISGSLLSSIGVLLSYR